MTTAWFQKKISLPAQRRGCHLVTADLVRQLPELKSYKVGLANFFLQHTSAALTLNENYDSDVRLDMETALNRLAPENAKYRHDAEGPDDMPGHIKSSLLGASVMVPIQNGKLALGTWQGIWLCEHRDSAHGRNVLVTIQGEKS
ncbi:hypothetical protein IWQ60_000488 [Tieghemiomyces parasiticus]|uniref:Secondary thiamine-phosphate synthase enzyme n=1 Tax=Tieghemiomyces parasiticus TaxID=78921 RepID=A0A9W8E3E6_9FUNG|nr:hypothetical protein IWQ60_000488 [Tieghemiomyces parasiticus]